MQFELSKYSGRVPLHFKSKSQIIRILSERWFLENMYCPACSGNALREYPANNPVIDFFCERCKQDYQLKGKKNSIGNKILDGEFFTMMRAVKEMRLPNLAFFIYDPTKLSIKDLFFVPRYFFTGSIIEKRKPLSPTARRAGWTGCNILLDNIPESAKIFAIKDKEMISRSKVHDSWNRVEFMGDIKNLNARGWTSDVLRCVDNIDNKIFSLQDCYNHENQLSSLHPENRNIRPKIRQQLQILRDRGLLEFLGNGIYKKR